MALEWVVLGYAAAAEAIMIILLTIPGIEALRKGLIAVTRNLLKPFLSIVPFCLFLLMDIYWKYETRPSCDGDSCTPSEYLRHQKSIMKSQRNALLIASALVFYWILYSVTNLVVRIEQLNQRVKRLKNKENLCLKSPLIFTVKEGLNLSILTDTKFQFFACTYSSDESRNHLFFACTYSSDVWGHFLNKARLQPPSDFDAIINWARSTAIPRVLRPIVKLLLHATIYEVWRERNMRLHQTTSRPQALLTQAIGQSLRTRLAFLSRPSPTTQNPQDITPLQTWIHHFQVSRI